MSLLRDRDSATSLTVNFGPEHRLIPLRDSIDLDRSVYAYTPHRYLIYVKPVVPHVKNRCKKEKRLASKRGMNWLVDAKVNDSESGGLNRLKPRHTNCLSRLSRIEGQVRGIGRMIEEQRYCIEILTQLRSIKAALNKVETEVLKNHADHCIAQAVKSGNAEDQKKKFTELVELFERYKQ